MKSSGISRNGIQKQITITLGQGTIPPLRDAFRRDARIGRWLQVDPLGEKYPSQSPYNFVLNNPLRFVDVFGMQPTSEEDKDRDREKRLKRLDDFFEKSVQISTRVNIPIRTKEEKIKNEELEELILSMKNPVSTSGVMAGVGQYVNVIDDWWFDPYQMKWYPRNFHGNPFTSRQSQVVGRALNYRKLGRGLFYVSLPLSAFEGYIAYSKGNFGGVGKAGLDAIMSGLATFGGPFGLIIGTSYFLLNVLESSYPYVQPHHHQPFSIPDRTYVAPQKQIFRY